MRFVFPHAPVRPVTINYGMEMRAWYDILEMDVARRVDVESIERSSYQIERLIQRELDNGFVTEQILLAGFSQGGAIVLHTGLRFGQRLAGIIGLSTYLPTLNDLEGQRSQINAEIEILMAHGRHDPVIPMANAIATREELLRLGYSVHWYDYPMQHEVCLQEIKQLRDWILKQCP
jgi:phospholipase/carboxylesterase